jgi:hypothetical protein
MVFPLAKTNDISTGEVMRTLAEPQNADQPKEA